MHKTTYPEQNKTLGRSLAPVHDKMTNVNVGWWNYGKNIQGRRYQYEQRWNVIRIIRNSDISFLHTNNGKAQWIFHSYNSAERFSSKLEPNRKHLFKHLYLCMVTTEANWRGLSHGICIYNMNIIPCVGQMLKLQAIWHLIMCTMES